MEGSIGFLLLSIQSGMPMYSCRGRVVYTYFFKGYRIKMWVATVNALDPGKRGPWLGSCALEEPALTLFQSYLP